MDAYETIKECYITGLPLSDLHVRILKLFLKLSIIC